MRQQPLGQGPPQPHPPAASTRTTSPLLALKTLTAVIAPSPHHSEPPVQTAPLAVPAPPEPPQEPPLSHRRWLPPAVPAQSPARFADPKLIPTNEGSTNAVGRIHPKSSAADSPSAGPPLHSAEASAPASSPHRPALQYAPASQGPVASCVSPSTLPAPGPPPHSESSPAAAPRLSVTLTCHPCRTRDPAAGACDSTLPHRHRCRIKLVLDIQIHARLQAPPGSPQATVIPARSGIVTSCPWSAIRSVSAADTSITRQHRQPHQRPLHKPFHRSPSIQKSPKTLREHEQPKASSS